VPRWTTYSATAWFEHPREFVKGRPLLKCESIAGHGHRLSYGDGTVFHVSSDAGEIWASWTSPYTVEDALTYLYGPILGFALRLRGIVCLHASAVQIAPGRAVLFVGEARSGKSTLAAGFVHGGFPAVTEDVAPIDVDTGVPTVRRGYPLIRLWDASACALLGESEALPRLTPNWEKRGLLLGEQDFTSARNVRIACVFVLQPREKNAVRPGFTKMNGAGAVWKLVQNTYINYLSDRDTRAREFELLCGLAGQVPTVALTLPDDQRLLGSACAHIAQFIAERV